MTAPVFLVAPDRLRAANEVLLDGEEGRHAAVVRRLGVGSELLLSDGAGHVASCLVLGISRSGLRCEITSAYDVPPAQPRLVAVQALAKGGRDEQAVELLTEVGVDVIVPWAAQRCIVQWRGDRGLKAHAKWVTTTREAAKQARRAWLPEVAPLAGLSDVIRLVEGAALPVILHESADLSLADLTVPGAGDVLIVIGPEGGITSDELAAMVAAGGIAVRMGHPVARGGTVLRSSSAGVVAAAALLSRTPRWA